MIGAVMSSAHAVEIVFGAGLLLLFLFMWADNTISSRKTVLYSFLTVAVFVVLWTMNLGA